MGLADDDGDQDDGDDGDDGDQGDSGHGLGAGRDQGRGEGLFYMPSVPTPMVKGTEKWGGMTPRGFVSPDHTPMLPVDAILPVARRIQAEDEPKHKAAWPNVPLPGNNKKSSSTAAKKSATTGARGSDDSEVVHEDFGMVPFANTTLLAWAEANLPLGTEASVGSPWRPDGGSGEEGKSLRIHREADGCIWAKDFSTKKRHVHTVVHLFGPVEGFDELWVAEALAFVTARLQDEDVDVYRRGEIDPIRMGYFAIPDMPSQGQSQ